jgi:hypothetical protein
MPNTTAAMSLQDQISQLCSSSSCATWTLEQAPPPRRFQRKLSGKNVEVCQPASCTCVEFSAVESETKDGLGDDLWSFDAEVNTGNCDVKFLSSHRQYVSREIVATELIGVALQGHRLHVPYGTTVQFILSLISSRGRIYRHVRSRTAGGRRRQ